MFKFSSLRCFLPNYKSLFGIMNALSSEKRCLTSMAFCHQAALHTNLLPFQGAWPGHMIAVVSLGGSEFCLPKGVSEF